MKFWCKIFTLFCLLAPVCLSSDDAAFEELSDFDDDAFLTAKADSSSSAPLLGWSLFKSDDGEDKYIINFNNVSIAEYVRFVSKIACINFQFEEAELDFTTTIISEQPLSVQNILSALIQTLRARGFAMLEHENTLLITRNREINQIPSIISPEGSTKGAKCSPIVTRVFRVENANLNSIASIIRPMMSQGAMVDISNETRQLIITDLLTNVDKIAVLLKSLDTPHSPLELDMYKVHHLDAQELAKTAKELVEPFAEENTLIYVPQQQTNTIYIVSTPHLIERSIEIMEDLDREPKDIKRPVGDQVFLYQIKNKSPDDLLEAIQEVAEELQGTGSQSVKLIAALGHAKWIKDSNSLMFVTDTETEAKIEAILNVLDTFSDSRNFLIYKIDQSSKDQIEGSLDQLSKSLRKGDSDRDLVEAITSMRYIRETNSFIFTGSDESLKKLREILPTFDQANGVGKNQPAMSQFWLYNPQFLTGKELQKALGDLENSLSSSGLKDDALLGAIKSVKWVPATNVLLFTGDPGSLEHIQSIIKLIDVPNGAPSKIFLYKPQYISNEQIEEALDELADKLDRKNISDRNLEKAIDDMTWINDTQSFLFKADPGTIQKIEDFLKEIDTPKEAESIASSYFLFKLKFARGDDVIDELEKIANNLPARDPSQKAIANVIDNASYLKDTNSILITGPQKAVDEVKLLITQFDVADSELATYEKTSFYIYKPRYITPNELEEGLKETARDLKRSGLIDPSLLQSIDTLQVVDITASVIFTGTKESLEKTQEIISTIDIAGEEKILGEFTGHSFFIYKVQYISVDQLMKLLGKVASNFEKDRIDNRQLIQAIKSAKEIKETRSILFTGAPATLEKLGDLLKQLDSPEEFNEFDAKKKKSSKQGLPTEPGNYVVYKPVNLSGPELIDLMSDFETNLKQSGIMEKGVFETIDRLRYIQRTGYILISGDQNSVEKVQELLRKFDVPDMDAITSSSLTQLETSFLIYKLHYHTGEELKNTLKTIGADLSNTEPSAKRLLSAINSLQWIKATNSLLATGSPDVLTQLKELIQNIDIPLRQVFIEVLIIQTTVNNLQEFGLQWGSKFQYLNRFAGGVSNFPSQIPAGGSRAIESGISAVNATRTPVSNDIPNPSSSNGGFDLGVIGDIILHRGKSFVNLASLVNAIQADNDAVIVMNPKIVAQDNQQATIFVGQNIPFTGSNVETTQGGGSQVQANIEYRDVGTNLTITPILGTNEIVTLDISNEITAQVANTTANGANLQGLQTSRTALNARVHVPNKHFVALSGMLSDTKTHMKSGIPCLGGLPVVGAIFSNNGRTNARDNLIFFIRPVIIDSIEEYDQITENQECLYKELGSKQIVKEEIDEGISWVTDWDMD